MKLESLYSFGLSDATIKSMLEMNPNITDEDIRDKNEILTRIGCSTSQFTNIVSCNPLFLSRANEGIIKLIKYLTDKGFTWLNILFDSNPYILNLEPFEIDNYIKDRLSIGDNIADIIDDLDSNPYLFNQI